MNAHIRIDGLGWRKIQPTSRDGVTNMFIALCEAFANNRRVNLYADNATYRDHRPEPKGDPLKLLFESGQPTGEIKVINDDGDVTDDHQTGHRNHLSGWMPQDE